MYLAPCCYEIDENDLKIDNNKLHINLHSLSKESWNFHSSYAEKIGKAYDVYSEPNPIYSNIKNGKGIFAGESITVLQVNVEDK